MEAVWQAKQRLGVTRWLQNLPDHEGWRRAQKTVDVLGSSVFWQRVVILHSP